MISVRKSEFIKFESEAALVRAELDVDTAEELPEADGLTGVKLAHGSIAHVVTTGDFYCLADDGAWYAQDGSDADKYPVEPDPDPEPEPEPEPNPDPDPDPEEAEPDA